MSFITDNKNNLRISIKQILFSMEDGNSIVTVDYSINDKEKRQIKLPKGDPVMRAVIHQISKDSFRATDEPELHDMVYSVKAAMEYYLANKNGLDSEALGKVNFEDNAFIKTLRFLNETDPKEVFIQNKIDFDVEIEER